MTFFNTIVNKVDMLEERTNVRRELLDLDLLDIMQVSTHAQRETNKHTYRRTHTNTALLSLKPTPQGDRERGEGIH